VRESYLDSSAILAAARASASEAIHPGYGLLSENPAFAKAVRDAGLVFVGPPPEAMAKLGDKLEARALARSVGVEPPPGTADPVEPADEARLLEEAARIGYPLLVKAAAGGGGIGMARANGPDELRRAAVAARDRARQAFADERVYLERYMDRPRHVEVQVFVDRSGNAVALGERECSVQRRHQKVIEETPSPAPFFVGEEGERARQALFEQALRVVRAAGYLGAGTVEFIVDASGTAYFLEVNARLQVEHPVTEMVTGLDLVELQLRIAAGEELPEDVLAAEPQGHAVEARLYAEDPAKGFVPQPGRLERLRFPEELIGVRVDAGFREGSEITPFYDPLIAKIIGFGPTRAEAIRRLDQALERTELALVGPKGPRATNRELLRRVLANSEFRSGDYDTHLIERIGTKA
jgi:acetyl-CoA carboxylase biotin carboxylase subunit/3-methylcrotonyl-CoA carboxylase alpha subunit